MNASNITDSANMTVSAPSGTGDMDKALYRTLAQVSDQFPLEITIL